MKNNLLLNTILCCILCLLNFNIYSQESVPHNDELITVTSASKFEETLDEAPA